MKRILSTLAIGLSMFALPATAQEIAKVGLISAPMPSNFENVGDCGHNMAFAAGLRYTMKSEGNFTMAFAALHEWRTTRLEHGTVDGVEVFSDLTTRSFQFQAYGQYKLATCTSACGGVLSALVGADLYLPYHTNAEAFTAAMGEGASARTVSQRAGFGVRAGLRMSKPMCERMGFFVSPEFAYKLIQDHGDYAAELGLPDQSSDLSSRFGMGLQMGVYLKLDKGLCPMKH
ncbi:MAG: hypothetical protein WAU70_05925 [Flavobacteriales bacterium]